MQGSLKYVNEVGGKGGRLNFTKATKGLNKSDKVKIWKKWGSVFFDGVDPNLSDKVPANVSGTLPSLTGKDGKITDLKSYDPSLPASSVNSVPPLSLAQASSSQASNECKYTISSYLCEKSKREERIELIDKLISTKQDAINNYNYLLKDCSKYGTCETWQKAIAEAQANIACYQAEKSAINAAVAKCRKCPDGTWADLSTGKCPGECPEGQVAKPDGTCGCPDNQILVDGKCAKPPEHQKCPNPCYCGLYSNEPKCGLVDCEQLCVKEGYDPLETYEPRPLMPSEKKMLREVFGDSINYDKVIIEHRKGQGSRPYTDGKNIVIYDEYVDEEGKVTTYFKDNALTDKGKASLIHEATHVWQRQHTNLIIFLWKRWLWGAKLFIISAKAKYDDDPETTVKKAIEYMYNWRRDADREVPFEKLNYEQQAEVVKEYFKGSYEEKYKNYIEEAIKKVRAKKKK